MSDAAQVAPDPDPQPAEAKPAARVKRAAVPFASFLESSAVLAHATVTVECEYIGARYDLLVPDVQLFCNAEGCGRVGAFAPDAPRWTLPDRSTYTELKFLRYSCRACQKSPKLYAVRIRFSNEALSEAAFTKIGEEPPNIGPTPRSLRDLLGASWVLYLKGVRSELAGLELGAFVYYRRAVDRMWPALLDRLITLAQRGGLPEHLQQLQEAKEQKVAARSMELAKVAVPKSFYVEMINPLAELVDACGDRAREYSSTECTARAETIRRMLTQLAALSEN
jgi:hypothetical protein